VTECVQQGEGTVKEGKTEVSFELYKKLMEWRVGITGKEAFFFRSYLGKYLEFYVSQQQHGKDLQLAFCVASRFSWGPFCA
jgi:hypothetical protein